MLVLQSTQAVVVLAHNIFRKACLGAPPPLYTIQVATRVYEVIKLKAYGCNQ